MIRKEVLFEFPNPDRSGSGRIWNSQIQYNRSLLTITRHCCSNIKDDIFMDHTVPLKCIFFTYNFCIFFTYNFCIVGVYWLWCSLWYWTRNSTCWVNKSWPSWETRLSAWLIILLLASSVKILTSSQISLQRSFLCTVYVLWPLVCIIELSFWSPSIHPSIFICPVTNNQNANKCAVGQDSETMRVLNTALNTKYCNTNQQRE